ncbi:MAG: YbdD/YjiX family protein [Gemmatimonadaceae bacterium]
MSASHALSRGARVVACVIRAVIGVPDYERYVAHLRLHHPDRVPLGRSEFTRQQMEARYSRPGSRCC